MTALHTFGWQKESELRPWLEDFLDEPLTKTANRYDSIDFLSDSYSVELKCRRGIDNYKRKVDSKTHDTWLLPACKLKGAEGKEHIYFYWFEGDNSLWMLRKEDVDWSEIICEVPWFHTQLHYYVPKTLWKRIW